MNSDPSTDWLKYSLLRLSPHVFFHHIWTDFIHANIPFSYQLIEELNQAAEQLRAGNDLNNACQIWLICAVLESRLDNYAASLTLIEKTAEFAQNHHLLQISSWANWGASSLCARQGEWSQAIRYLQQLQQTLHQQGDWMLANIVNILEMNLCQLMAKREISLPTLAITSQLNVILEHLLHWESPILTLPTASPHLDGCRPFSWHWLWQAMIYLFRERNYFQSTEQPSPMDANVLSFLEPGPKLPPSLVFSEPNLWQQPSLNILPTPAPNVTNKVVDAQKMVQLQNRPSTQEMTAKSLTLPPMETPKVVDSFDASKHDTPSLTVYCLGTFRVYQDEKPIEQWPSGKGKLIFKYLLTHRQRPIAKEVLMEQFWPDANPDAARNNLNVAIYGLRQALRNGYEDFSHVLFQDDHYLLNPELQIWMDFEAFSELWQTGKIHEREGECTQAIQAYNAAVALYEGEFLAEDRYEEWLLPQRQQLQEAYLHLLDQLSLYHFQNETYAACIEACRHILVVEPCLESTHRLLMRCYCRQGQRYLGLRQYHQCVEALDNELEVAPSPETTYLYTQIRHHEPV